MSAVTIGIAPGHCYDDLHHRGHRHSLVLTPTNDGAEVYVYAAIGSGTPESVWHGRAREIRLPDCTSDALIDWLEDHEALILEIAAGYQGTAWDGHNRVGSWTEAASDLCDELARRLRDAELPCRCDASDWFAGDSASRRDILARHAVGKTVTEIAEGEIAAAAHVAVLDPEEVEAYVREVITDREEHVRQLLAEVTDLVGGDDDPRDLGVVVRQAVCDDARVTAEEIAEIVREARAEHEADDASE